MASAQPGQNESADPIHIIHHAFRLGGGKERCAVALAAALRQMGRKVTVHAMTADAALAQSLGIELKMTPVSSFPRKLQTFKFFRQLERAQPQMNGLQISLSRVRVRDVLVCGGCHRGYLARTKKWTGPFDVLQLWMERQSCRSARVIVAHSDLIASDLARHYQSEQQKIRILYPPLDERFSKMADTRPRAELRKAFGWPEEKVVFLFPSKGHRNKGLHRVREAMQGFSNEVILAVAGKPAGSTGCSFISALGYIEDMAALYRAADFTILASYYEAFGLVGPESIRCGTRLVFEENIGCLPVVKPEFVFTFSVRDVESMRTAIARAIALARSGEHHINPPVNGLRYDPSPMTHARAVLNVAKI